MGKYLSIFPYIRKPFLIYDFATAPLWTSFYNRNILFSFLSVYIGVQLVQPLRGTLVMHYFCLGVALLWYLNVRQNKLDINIIQTLHILQHDGADTDSLSQLPMGLNHNPNYFNYFQITQPGSSTALHPVTLICMLQSKGQNHTY